MPFDFDILLMPPLTALNISTNGVFNYTRQGFNDLKLSACWHISTLFPVALQKWKLWKRGSDLRLQKEPLGLSPSSTTNWLFDLV